MPVNSGFAAVFYYVAICDIFLLGVLLKIQTTQVNYVDVKGSDTTTTYFIFTDNTKDSFSILAGERLSKATLHKVTSMLKCSY